MNNDIASSKEVRNYAAQMQALASGDPWFGSSYEHYLGNLSAEKAFRQPLPGVHSVAEILSHVRWWRYFILRRLQGDSNFKFTMKSPENWLPLETLRQEGWENIRAEADRLRDEIIQFLENQTDDFLDRLFLQRDGQDYSMRYIVEGVLHHDIYHLGQMALALRILEEQDKQKN